MSDVWSRSRLVSFTRDVLEHEPFTSLGRAAYYGIAWVAARELAVLPHVDGVYRGGSMRRASAFAPGYSDVDLYVVADLGTAERERELRESLMRFLARRAPIRVLKHVDVGTVHELERSRRFGGAWSVDLDRRFLCLAGTDRTVRSSPPRASDEVRVLEVAESFRRWTKASPNLVDERLRRDPRERARGSARLLADVLAASLGADRLDPLPELVAAARDRGLLVGDEARADRWSRLGVESDRARVALAGDLLDRIVAEWVTGDRERRELPPIDRSVGSIPDIDRVSRSRVTGLVTVPGHRYGGVERTFAIGAEGESTGSILLRLLEDDVRVSGSIPVAASTTLIAASFFLDPFPFAASSLRASRGGIAVVVPEPEIVRILARARLVASPRRTRGRMLRQGVDPSRARAAARRELAIGHGLADALAADHPWAAVLSVDADAGSVDESLVRLETRIDELLGGML